MLIVNFNSVKLSHFHENLATLKNILVTLAVKAGSAGISIEIKTRRVNKLCYIVGIDTLRVVGVENAMFEIINIQTFKFVEWEKW